ncbi:ectoine hydrolase DoeA [Hypericibacter terrae]|jgi:Xaa-Pro aminopeptidase|uniref:Ectoine hydrolase DoeA n=1 Tax=Hypericibacter terrae TaxID=2602015 RepID=A0A5J6MLY9_9PROT|nr:Xaa-Pro peptidase family protein [Hypericibacter terrae]QEX18231.1 ectoine hydrolase DoeA [Hypericibacter terrae]
MQDYLRKQIDWPQPFSGQEYADRLARVRNALQNAKLDAIYVTTPANLTWLTGYDMIWYHTRCLTGLLIRADSDHAVWFDSVGHTTIVSLTPTIKDVVWCRSENVTELVRLVVDEIGKRISDKSKIALEPWGYSPHADVMNAVKSGLESKGKTTSDASTLIERLRLVKSPDEIAVVRQAATLADNAMAAARDILAPGIMETEIEAAIMSSLMRQGGGYPGIRSMIGSGPRAGTHHSAATQRKVKKGDLVFVDFCSSLHRYHVNLNRTFTLGKPDSRWGDLMKASAGCVDKILASVKPGDPWSKVATVGEDYLVKHDIHKYIWWQGGYALGISVPPDWVGSFFADPLAGIDDQPLQPGMVFNYENQFDVWENWDGGSGAAYIETLLVTDRGLEVLSKLPRDLILV